MKEVGLLLLASIAGAHGSIQEKERHPIQPKSTAAEGYTWAGDQMSISEPVTLEKVITLIQSRPDIRKVEDLLSQLPKTFLSNYTLMHQSESLHSASPDYPRAIVFGTDASFVLAFSGILNSPNSNILEMFQFHPETASFEFKEIEFPEGDPTTLKAKISESNPKKCLTCHHSDPRPNWENYQQWPGAFGSRDDDFENSDLKIKDRLLNFLDHADHLPRYRQLVNVKEGYARDPNDSRTIVPHNQIFNQRVAMHNFRRVARLMSATPDFNKYKFAIVGRLWCKKEIREFFPDELRGMFEPYLDKISKEPDYILDGLSAREFFDARGISIDSFYLDFLTPPHRMAFDTAGQTQFELTGSIVDRNPDLLPYFDVKDGAYVSGADSRLGSPKKGACWGLSQKSFETLSR